WKSGNIREYTVAVHALKSSSRLIGALGLSAMAAELEAMGDANETETIDLKTPELIFTYRSFYDKLSAVCEESQTSGDDDARGREPIDPGQLAEAYGAVKEAVTAFDYDTADEIIKTLKEYALPADESERFDRICDLVTKLDRDALLEEL
ncbi:MAG: hybrid sensor histidine kinase/response regulator, partial [Lachnospiraceae bacterium]|nr:hybrid sensor histidine kinase/response regulator [Lachnospiraceae bacterium]